MPSTLHCSRRAQAWAQETVADRYMSNWGLAYLIRRSRTSELSPGFFQADALDLAIARGGILSHLVTKGTAVSRPDWTVFHALNRSMTFPSVRSQAAKYKHIMPKELGAISDRTLRQALTADRSQPDDVHTDVWRHIYVRLRRHEALAGIAKPLQPSLDAMLWWITKQFAVVKTRPLLIPGDMHVWRRAWGQTGWAQPVELPSGRLRLPIERLFFRLGSLGAGFTHQRGSPDAAERPRAAYLFWHPDDAPGTPRRAYDAHLRRFCERLPGAPDLRSRLPQPTRMAGTTGLIDWSVVYEQPWLPAGAHGLLPNSCEVATLQRAGKEHPLAHMRFQGALLLLDDAYAAAALQQRILGLLWWLQTPRKKPDSPASWAISSDLIWARDADRRRRRKLILDQHAALCMGALGGVHPLDGILGDADEWP